MTFLKCGGLGFGSTVLFNTGTSVLMRLSLSLEHCYMQPRMQALSTDSARLHRMIRQTKRAIRRSKRLLKETQLLLKRSQSLSLMKIAGPGPSKLTTGGFSSGSSQ